MPFKELIIRCHALSSIMARCDAMITDAQKKTLVKLKAKGDDVTTKQNTERTRLQKKLENPPKFDLSEGAKTCIESLVNESKHVLNYNTKASTKQMTKGNIVEDESIELYNNVRLTRHKKNIVRKTNAWISGECDIYSKDLIVDMKNSWSKATFPMLPNQIKVGGYAWQGHGYMFLYDVPRFELCFALVKTPEELIEWEDNLTPFMGIDDVPMEMRLTSLYFDRDKAKEEKIKHKVTEARKYATWYYEQILNK